MGQRTPMNLLPGAKGYKSPAATAVRPNASDVVFKDFTTGLAPGGYKAGLGKSGVTQPTTAAVTNRTAPKVSTKTSEVKTKAPLAKGPPAMVSAKPALAVPASAIGEASISGNIDDASATLAGYNPLYASGSMGMIANPNTAFIDAGFDPSTIQGSALDSGVYKPGQSILGRDNVFGDQAQYQNPEQSWNAPVNPEGQYTNLAGEGTVSLVTPQESGFNWNMSDIAEGAKAVSGLANAYLGYKNYGLAKDQFGFTKALANRNIANQASEYNTGLQNAGEVGMSLAGNTMDPNARAARQAQMDAQKISGAPIG